VLLEEAAGGFMRYAGPKYCDSMDVVVVVKGTQNPGSWFVSSGANEVQPRASDSSFSFRATKSKSFRFEGVFFREIWSRSRS